MGDGPDSEELTALREAFDLFRRSSGELTASYDALQGEVARLNSELAAAYQRLESELKQREQLLNLLPGAVLVLDPEGRIEEGNRQAHALFGSAVVRGQAWNGMTNGPLRAAEEPGEYRLERPEGERRMVVTASGRPPPGGEILLFTDVTDARERERERQRRERLADMGRMAANLAHQLRTPLATAVLYLSQLDSKELAPDRRAEYLDRARERLRRLEQLVRDALRHVRRADETTQCIDAGRLRVALEHGHGPLYRQKNVELRFAWSDDLSLPGSLSGWEAALGNILANALHFTAAGACVRVSLQERAETIELCVADEGPGLAPGLEDRLFEPFFTTRADGTGLGLSVARDHVQGLDGQIAAGNRDGGGCAVEISVPRTGTRLAAESTAPKDGASQA